MIAATATDADELRARVQGVLEDVLAHQADVLAEVSPDCAALVDAVARLVAGGKRLRPAFCYWGWRGARGPGGADGDRDGDGGAAEEAVVRAAAALELFQAAALIHDDVMDASDTRRGMPAVHRQFAALHRGSAWSGNAESFGSAGAILAGDLCLSWSDEVLDGAGLPAGALARARPVFDRMRTQLMGGQYLDMLAQVLPSSTGSGAAAEDAAAQEAVDRARRVIRFKSAKYTVEHPLLLGAALAGAEPELVAAYSAYGLALGEAFQLRDDVLGVFGDPEQTGKPAGDDLREGKRTVLIALALQRATPSQAAAVRRLLGDPALDDGGVARLREVVVDTGALLRVEAMIVDGVERSREALSRAPVDEAARAVLDGLVDAATTRAA
ncbi:polyprenyl synthetase family protein [Quadrisphaera sp. DSM 44207]|uniref:polyprenyl synthetase family protein n=1 Tax=Quadrisphaera sp. DSM 44207 TaxID=1881057 RepID=UPI000880F0DF|nr:polyprenyl synthetase family protein [Quadrisphaera sp. DSM 44207]SDQ77839.1 geranylgeranyl diphosphate synthase, type I [Quadrisphaera sp. DSM 44207]